MDDAALVVISPLNGFVLGNGKILLTKKFVDGMMAYRDLWKGELIHVCEPASQASDNLDNTEVDKSNSEFRTYCIELSEERLKAILPRRSVVLASVGEHFNSISRICQEANIPCVYVTEYNLRTRTEIANEYQRSKLHGAWSKLRQLQQEFRQRKALSLASGVQCNGLPTFEAYKSLTPSSLLYFDSRIDEQMLATDDQILSKVNRRYQADPIRLVFSGRINRIKGVDDLPIVAEHLRQMKIPFELSICGEGEYLAKLKQEISKRKLDDFVKLKGTLDFQSELIPFVTDNADLFVCCHRQGDPSCTYIETMACGVPIVGYANDAFKALANFSNVGWATPEADPLEMASRIARLYRDPETVNRASRASRLFAGKHTFRDTFRRRINHLERIAHEGC